MPFTYFDKFESYFDEEIFDSPLFHSLDSPIFETETCICNVCPFQEDVTEQKSKQCWIFQKLTYESQSILKCLAM